MEKPNPTEEYILRAVGVFCRTVANAPNEEVREDANILIWEILDKMNKFISLFPEVGK